jgi:hypothetical protein
LEGKFGRRVGARNHQLYGAAGYTLLLGGGALRRRFTFKVERCGTRACLVTWSPWRLDAWGGSDRQKVTARDIDVPAT